MKENGKGAGRFRFPAAIKQHGRSIMHCTTFSADATWHIISKGGQGSSEFL